MPQCAVLRDLQLYTAQKRGPGIHYRQRVAGRLTAAPLRLTGAEFTRQGGILPPREKHWVFCRTVLYVDIRRRAHPRSPMAATPSQKSTDGIKLQEHRSRLPRGRPPRNPRRAWRRTRPPRLPYRLVCPSRRIKARNRSRRPAGPPRSRRWRKPRRWPLPASARPGPVQRHSGPRWPPSRTNRTAGVIRSHRQPQSAATGTTDAVPLAAAEAKGGVPGVAAAMPASAGVNRLSPFVETLLTKAAPTDMPASCVSGSV